ncbi:hypothetical protein A1O3_10252 [Capronia epimyces CBS 606.96]|uniref:Protein NO VEIN C-terminal domain-containing protein n=1 Tax=Capronia epimyces CBS 606.96 TaxID=1182542 RepID=W9Y3Q1_9EURO|nr:uncharacterized protein A1O3_10252 [Capronia epimyces CBS 606.96]EXJ77094.1 hypothetical protein A1O3_10252 [Capronia epimyces CBS 606.96]
MAALAQAQPQPDQARRHIDTIRREAGLETGQGSNRNVQNLQNALHTLAEELYQKSTHFLLELIQNADDNEYDVAEPSITLTYKNRYLRVDCNERGFSPKNVEAICRVGSSTKAGQDRASSYVGEKGIGFKSVFKAADVVWISSNSYTFKFDKRQVLGMIAPIWEPFPGPSEPSMTSILLQLSPDYQEKGLLSDLKQFDPRMLMFLRRLKRVKIIIHEGGAPWETTLSKNIGISHQETSVELTQDDKTMRYLVSSYTARSLAPEPKRPGATESQIMLAFPDFAETETIEPQKVYAFLPIRDYGFNFLLHGDFLLSANREDILDHSEWNWSLRREFVDAFVAVAKTYSHSQLGYIWPRYIPLKSTQSQFFAPARQAIIAQLSQERVLKCRTSELRMPCSLFHVPKDFCDKEGIPMTSTTTSDQRYLSPQYSDSLKENLELLGVKEMTDSIFLDHLSALLDQDAVSFQKQKSVAWHTRLAEILLKLSFEAANHERIVDLPVIPLSDGRWVSAKEEYIYLPQEAENCPAPEGFRLSLVREDAANHPTARSLYLQLGLKVLGQDSIALGIINEHMKESFNPYSMTVPQLISQLAFLFHARIDDLRVKHVWVTTGIGSARFRAEETYLPSKNPFAASHYFAGRPEIPFLHADYSTAGRENTTRWFEWLESVAGMSILPRLTERVLSQPRYFRLSRHFLFIMESNEPKDFLVLLRDNWNHYSSWFEDDGGVFPNDSRELSRERVIKEIQASPVRCRGGITKSLRDVFLPIPELVDKAQGQVPFIDVADPLDQRWRRLGVLGLGVEGNVSFYLRCLESMRGKGDPAPVDRATMLLEQIQARYSDDEELVRKYFTEKPLICIPNTQAGRPVRWAKVQDCLWSGPECLRRFVALKNIYPSCQRLFRDFFLVADATISDVVRELTLINIGDPLAYIRSLFLELEKQLEKDETSTAVDSLQTHSIWPIYTTEDKDDWDALGCAREPIPWFIADRVHLLESFQGLVPLLAFQVEDILKMPLLIRKLGVDRRRLTRAATSIAETVDVVHSDTACQDDLRSKADFIARLIPQKERGKMEKVAKLKALKVFSTSRVIQKWSVPVGQEAHPGRAKDGSVVLATEHEVLEIYLKERYFEENKTPADLVEAIAGFCAIEDRHSLLLTIALTEKPPKVHEWFQRHGISALNLEDDLPDDVTDIDDFDPRKKVGTTPRRIYKTVVLKDDLVRMFVPFASLQEFGMGGLALAYQVADGTSGLLMDHNWNAADLYLDDDDKSIVSKAESSWSGTTIGGGGAKLLGLLGGSKMRRKMFQKTLTPAVNEDLEYVGQRKVSHELRRMLGKAYDPNKHWTSPLRTRDGNKTFSPDRNSDGKPKVYASFTIKDTSKVFTRYLAQGYSDAAKWVVKPPVYHLDVKTTAGNLNSEFSVSNAQLKMARIYTIPAREVSGIPSNVYVLVRAFNTHDKDADIQFLLDPWSLYLANKMDLEADKEYRARLQGAGT